MYDACLPEKVMMLGGHAEGVGHADLSRFEVCHMDIILATDEVRGEGIFVTQHGKWCPCGEIPNFK